MTKVTHAPIWTHPTPQVPTLGVSISSLSSPLGTVYVVVTTNGQTITFVPS